MSNLTPTDYQRIITTLAAQKSQAEVAALEWQVRCENALRELEQAREQATPEQAPE